MTAPATRLLCATDAASLGLLAAALDAGLIGPGRRVLLLSSDAATPEVAPAPVVGGLRDRIDEVISWPALIAPLHPGQWQPPAAELPLLRRLFEPVLGSGDPVEVVAGSITDGVGRAVALLAPDAAITMLGSGLDSYGPLLRHAPSEVTDRVERLLYADLLPQLTARRLAHPGVVPTPVTVPDPAPVPRPGPAVDTVLLGARFAERGLIPAADQQRLHAGALRALAAAGARHVGYAPHPAADPSATLPLQQAADAAGVRLSIQPPVAHEVWAGADVRLAGWAEPVLLRAASAVTFDATALLDRPGPYERPDRIALTITDAALPHVGADGVIAPPAVTDLACLVDAVSFCLDPVGLPDLRDRAAEWVAERGTVPYLRKKRLAEHGVGAPPTASSASSRAVPRRRRRIFPGGTASR